MPRKTKGIRKNRNLKPQTIPMRYAPGFLGEMDGRTMVCRALQANYDSIVEDLGGADDLSEVKSTLVEKFCWLNARLQSLEHDMASGKLDVDKTVGKWIQGLNSLVGLARILGIERHVKTIDLESYVKGNGE